MGNPRSLLTIACAVFLVPALAPLWAAAPTAWEKDLGEALAAAKAAGKPVLVDFGAAWCGWCKKMDAETFTDPGVADLMGRFVCVKVDADARKDLVKQYGVKGLPTILLLDAEGQVVRKVSGFLGAERFGEELRRALDGNKEPQAPLPRDQAGDTENPLPAMVEAMEKSRSRLEGEETGRGTQEIQDKLLAELDELVKKAEQQEGG